MFDTTESQIRVARWAWGTALATLVVGQLHALARHRTEDGSADLDLPLTSAWAEPAGRALDPLLSWAGPDTVYLAYGKWWLPAFAVTVVAGFMVQQLRRPHGLERWGWRVTLTGLVLLAFGAGAFYWGQWTSYNVLEDIGLGLTMPGFLVGFIGSTMLGIALLRRGARPRPAAILLVLAIPGFLLISAVTSLGNVTLPLMFAIAVLASAETRRVAAERAGLSSARVSATQ